METFGDMINSIKTFALHGVQHGFNNMQEEPEVDEDEEDEVPSYWSAVCCQMKGLW